MMSMIIENNQDNQKGQEIIQMLVNKCFRNLNIPKRSLLMTIIDF